jgi:hypothetical protein
VELRGGRRRDRAGSFDEDAVAVCQPYPSGQSFGEPTELTVRGNDVATEQSSRPLADVAAYHKIRHILLPLIAL